MEHAARYAGVIAFQHNLEQPIVLRAIRRAAKGKLADTLAL